MRRTALRDAASRYTLAAMRIIAGKWRGRQIAAPEGERTRPITDRAKTVLFDMLGHRLDRPGSLPPLAVLDLFAGSGTLGIEALSRGARFALFVERYRPAVVLIRRNLELLGVAESQGRVLADDATHCELPPPPGSPAVYSLVFVDPPYQLLAGPAADPSLRPLLQRLATDPLIADDAFIVVRHKHRPVAGPGLTPLIEIERRDVGSMTFRFMGTGRLSTGRQAVPAPAADGDTG